MQLWQMFIDPFHCSKSFVKYIILYSEEISKDTLNNNRIM